MNNKTKTAKLHSPQPISPNSVSDWAGKRFHSVLPGNKLDSTSGYSTGKAVDWKFARFIAISTNTLENSLQIDGFVHSSP